MSHDASSLQRAEIAWELAICGYIISRIHNIIAWLFTCSTVVLQHDIVYMLSRKSCFSSPSGTPRETNTRLAREAVTKT